MHSIHCLFCNSLYFMHMVSATKNPFFYRNEDVDPLMNKQQPNNPLHGVTLKQIVNSLVEYYGWDELGSRIDIRCFNYEPSVSSSLTFLRKTPWARKKVESLYIATQKRR